MDDQWLQIGIGESVADAATRSLRLRLEAVRELLPRAARDWKHNPDAVHQLRVATRRALAALTLYKDLIPRRIRRRIVRQLRYLRSAAGEARDLDVLIEKKGDRPGRRKLVRWLQTRRRQAQRPIIQLDREHARHHRLARQIEKLLVRIPRNRAQQVADLAYGPWARAAVGRIGCRFFDAATPLPHDLSGLHRLRIRGKSFRYSLELAATTFRHEHVATWYQNLEELQDNLGKINDHVVARQHFNQLLQKADSPRLALRARSLIRQEDAALSVARLQLGSRWTPERLLQFRDEFEQALVPGGVCDNAG